MYSIVIPVYRNVDSLQQLVAELERIAVAVFESHQIPLEVVFVVDASPDASHLRLLELLPCARFKSQLLTHSRNFGSFAAIRSGMALARGDYIAVMAADLQEPPDVLLGFLAALTGDDCDLVVGTRQARSDPALTRLMSGVFWQCYRMLVMPDIPKGGVDIFACTRPFRDQLLKLGEANSSLIGQLFWLGFRRKEIGYVRRPRPHGTSAWSFNKKINYLFDSIFSFTDLPIRILMIVGAVGVLAALIFGSIVLTLRISGAIDVPGYAATVITVAFFGALNLFGLGLVGSYAWRAYDNTKGRPLSIVSHVLAFEGAVRANAEAVPEERVRP
jgi:glycosyltransferase involved in cell wall biosynthesis